MTLFRSFLFLCVFSLAAVTGLFFLGSMLAVPVSPGGYAVLSTDASVDESVLLELLTPGIAGFAGAPVSLSSQWVFLDNFDSLRKIPLDQYFQTIFYFDPRNDGYAEKVKNIFLRDDTRFIFLPVKESSRGVQAINNKLNTLLADISFNVEFFGISKPLQLFFFAFAAASLALVFILFIFSKIKPANLRWSASGVIAVVFLLPALSSLAFFGVGGIAAAALFLGFAALLHGPLKELIMLLRLPAGGTAQKLNLINKNVLEPYSRQLLLLPVFAAGITLVIMLTDVSVFFILLVFIVVCIVFFLTVSSFAFFENRRRRFTPVQIIRRRAADFSFSVCILPFAIAALVVLLLTPQIPASFVSDSRFDYIITEQDYHEHVAFQASFSKRRLGNHHSSFNVYKFGDDGLLTVDRTQSAKPVINFSYFPPFPLQHLMEFFYNVNNSGKIDSAGNRGRITEYISLLILFLFVIPGIWRWRVSGFFVKGKTGFKYKDIIGLRYITGKRYRNEIIWRKNKTCDSEFRIRKDA